ncbi:MAG: hypothetical protein ACLSG5_17435 [Oscillospiraceae bacterium]
MNGKVFTFSDFGKLVIDRRQQDVTNIITARLSREFIRVTSTEVTMSIRMTTEEIFMQHEDKSASHQARTRGENLAIPLERQGGL